MAKTARRRIFARVAQGDAHTANGVDANTLTLAERSKKLLYSSLLSCQLLFIRTIERRAPTASFMIEQGDLGSTALRADEAESLCGRLERVRGALSPPRRESERLVLALLLVDLPFAS